VEVTCFSCEHKNPPEHTFCGACGAPLSLSSYVSREVDARLAEATRDRQILETESSIRVFEKAWSWAKLVGGIVTGVAAILIAGAALESFNLHEAVKGAGIAVETAKTSAEKSISDTASNTRSNMLSESGKSAEDIRSAAARATASSNEAQIVVKKEGSAITQQADALRKDFQNQATTVTKDVASARQQIEAASQLEPQMQSMQQQLSAAQAQIKEQQRVITSSADFAKQIFSSHRQGFFEHDKADKYSFAILPVENNLAPIDPSKPPTDALYVLLPEAVVGGTVQMQFNQIVAAPNSFFVFHNLIIAFLDKNAENILLQKPVSIGYFPDPEDLNLIRKLEVKDGRVFGDDEALPKFGQIDPDFKGSKWMRISTTPSPTAAPTPTPAPSLPPK
jgi:hypothetical protein